VASFAVHGPSELAIPPYLNFELGVTFRSLVSGKRYRYTGKITLYEDCCLSDQRRYAVGPETMPETPAR
jgi:hypothetical protein